MKKLLISIALFLFSLGTSYASTNALCLGNQAGGKIVLTTVKDDDGYIVFSTDSGGMVIYGTWVLIGDFTVMILWNSYGRTSMFDISAFSPCRL